MSPDLISNENVFEALSGNLRPSEGYQFEIKFKTEL